MRAKQWAVLAALLLTSGCSADAWPLHAAGPHAGYTNRLWWLFLAVTSAIWLGSLAVIA